jgi:Ca2+-binding RTX toxin-like protein
MATLFVPAGITTDYSAMVLAGIDAIEFLGAANAVFAAAQFDNVQILTTVNLVGTAGVNSVQVNGSSLNASAWTFSSWSSTEDSIIINGTTGNDTFVGSSRTDVIDGGGGNDAINGGPGADTLMGNAGNDTLVSVNAGADKIDGGADSDFARVSRAALAVGLTIDLTAGGGGVNIGDGTTIADVERIAFTGGSAGDDVIGGALNDVLIGNDGANDMDGAGGNDILRGGPIAELLTGGTGNDTVRGGDGGDNMDGGAGIDTLDYTDSFPAVTINLFTGFAGGGFAAGDVFVNFENVIGSAGADSLGGDGNPNRLLGAAGNDNLGGGDSKDTLNGGDGNDLLTGDLGGDVQTGGAGLDFFRYLAPAESPAGAGRDLLLDFAQGFDTINVAAIDANATVAGNQAFVFAGAGAPLLGQLRYFQTATHTVIQAEINGAAGIDFQIACLGIFIPNAGDFLL